MIALVSNRARGNNSVGNKLNQLDSRVSRTEKTETPNPLTTDTVTSDTVASGAIQDANVSRGAIGTEHLGIVSEINSDSSLTLNIGGTTGHVIISGDQYPAPAAGTGKTMTLDETGAVTLGMNSGELDTKATALVNATGSALRPALKAASVADLATTYNAYGGIRVASLQNLFDLMGSTTAKPPVGSIIHVGNSIVPGAGTHYASVWRVINGGNFVEPMPGCPILLDNLATLTQLTGHLRSPGAWSSRLSMDNRISSAVISTTAGGGRARQEWRWDVQGGSTGMAQFRLWPSNETYSEISYYGGTDQQLVNNNYYIYQFDTVDFDGLLADYLGTTTGQTRSSYKLNYEGRYEFWLRFSPTNQYLASSNSYIMSTIYNETVGGDSYMFHGYGTPGDIPYTVSQNRWFFGGHTIRVAFYNGGTNNQWIRRGNGSTLWANNCPKLVIKYIGWG